MQRTRAAQLAAVRGLRSEAEQLQNRRHRDEFRTATKSIGLRIGALAAVVLAHRSASHCS